MIISCSSIICLGAAYAQEEKAPWASIQSTWVHHVRGLRRLSRLDCGFRPRQGEYQCRVLRLCCPHTHFYTKRPHELPRPNFVQRMRPSATPFVSSIAPPLRETPSHDDPATPGRLFRLGSIRVVLSSKIPLMFIHALSVLCVWMEIRTFSSPPPLFISCVDFSHPRLVLIILGCCMPSETLNTYYRSIHFSTCPGGMEKLALFCLRTTTPKQRSTLNF